MQKAKAQGLDPESVPLVFPSTNGQFYWGSNFDRYVWRLIREAAGIPDSCTFHGLPHTQALLLYSSGSMRVIQARLGHSKFETTSNLHTNLLQGAQAEATSKLEEMMTRPKPVGTLRKRKKPAMPIDSTKHWLLRLHPVGLEPTTFGSEVRTGILLRF